MKKHHQPGIAPRSKASVTDPAHAPGKQHIAIDRGSAAMHTIDRSQMKQRTTGGGASVHNRRNERGR